MAGRGEQGRLPSRGGGVAIRLHSVAGASFCRLGGRASENYSLLRDMGPSQGRYLLLGLVLLLGASYITEGSVRPASVAEIREVLVWGPDRDIRKEIEQGILLPPLQPETNGEDEAWSKSINLFPAVLKPNPAVRQLFYIPLAKIVPVPDATAEQKYDETSPMPYVDSSQFRRSEPKVEAAPLEIVAVIKRLTGKSTNGPKAQYHKVTKLEKLTENKVPKKKYELDQSASESPVQAKTEDTLGERGHERPSASPPVWSHALVSDELSDPLGRLPSNEDYDRSSRYTHSILYGFNTGF